MKIVFGKLKIKNFLSFENETFDFSCPRKMTLICGKNLDLPGSKNGVGKSTIFSAILYCLYGQLQNKVRNENLRNRYVKSKEMELSLEFKVDNQSYTVVRGLHGNSSYLKLFKNDPAEEITKSSIAETDDFIAKEILHCDISIFSRIVYMTSEQTYNFFRLRQQAKKEFIEKLFNISIFGDMYTLIHKDTLRVEKDLAAIQTKLLTLSNSQSEYEEEIRNFETEKRDRIKLLSENLESAKKDLEELKKSVPKTDGLDELQLQTDLDSINARYMKATTAINKLATMISEKEAEKAAASVRLKSGQKVVKTHENFINGLCDDCRPKAKKYFDIGKYEKEIGEASSAIEEADSLITALADKKSKADEKLAQIREKITSMKETISEAREKAREHDMAVHKVQTTVKLIESKLHDEQTSTNPYIGLMTSVKEKIEEGTKNFNQTTNDLNYLEMAENIVSQDSIKKFIVKDLVSILNANIRNYLMKMGANYTCIFDENMDYEFVTDGGVCEYDNFSSGEKMRLLIASSFAFKDFMMTRTSMESNILVIDEFIDSNLDTRAIESILKILKEYSYLYNQSIYVISHRHEIDNSVFDNIIQVVKQTNISKITYL